MKPALALVLLLAACGDSDKKIPDGGMQPTPDSIADAPPEEVTLTSYVIDLITNSTTATAQARPYSEFSMLPDPDTENPAAYSTLF